MNDPTLEEAAHAYVHADEHLEAAQEMLQEQATAYRKGKPDSLELLKRAARRYADAADLAMRTRRELRKKAATIGG